MAGAGSYLPFLPGACLGPKTLARNGFPRCEPYASTVLTVDLLTPFTVFVGAGFGTYDASLIFLISAHMRHMASSGGILHKMA